MSLLDEAGVLGAQLFQYSKGSIIAWSHERDQAIDPKLVKCAFYNGGRRFGRKAPPRCLGRKAVTEFDLLRRCQSEAATSARPHALRTFAIHEVEAEPEQCPVLDIGLEETIRVIPRHLIHAGKQSRHDLIAMHVIEIGAVRACERAQQKPRGLQKSGG